MRSRFNPDRWCDKGNVASRRINMAVREQGDGAFMAGLVRIGVNKLVQRLAGSQRGYKQNQADQQDGNERLVELTKIFLFVLQTVRNIAKAMPPARLIFEARLCNQDIPLGIKRRDRSFCRTTTCQSNTPPRFPIKRPGSLSLRAFGSNAVLLRQNVG